MNGCATINARLAPVRQQMGNPTWQELVAQCYNLGIDLSTKVIIYSTVVRYLG